MARVSSGREVVHPLPTQLGSYVLTTLLPRYTQP